MAPEELDSFMDDCGTLAENAASLVMNLMYGVRMAGLHLYILLARPSSQITKWTRDLEWKVQRIYSYMEMANNTYIYLSTSDIDKVMLIAWLDADLAGNLVSTKSTGGFFLGRGELR